VTYGPARYDLLPTGILELVARTRHKATSLMVEYCTFRLPFAYAAVWANLPSAARLEAQSKGFCTMFVPPPACRSLPAR